MPVSYKWRPIEDIGPDPNALTEGELDALGRVWATQKEDLAGDGGLDEFDKRLRREWAIETGVIERVYTLDRGVTRTLIARGIDAALIPHGSSNLDSPLVARIIQDHYEVLEGIFDFVGGQRELSTGYVKELHAALLANQSTHTVVDPSGQAFEKQIEKGVYKKHPNSPTRPDGTIHEYCPPEHVASEMDRLIEMYRSHQVRRVPTEVEAAFLHHRFTQIHPFADGNGRVARALASLVFIKAGWFPVIVRRDEWARYVETLEQADDGDLRPLVAMFVEGQRNAVIQATEIGYEVRPIETVEEAIAAVRERWVVRGHAPKEWVRAKETAGKLYDFTQARLIQLAGELRDALGTAFPVQGRSWGDASRSRLLVEVHQEADLAQYDNTVRLMLDPERALEFWFYALGPRFRGFISVIAHLGEAIVAGGTFQINYEEPLEHVQARFSKWIEAVFVEGLKQWRLTL